MLAQEVAPSIKHEDRNRMFSFHIVAVVLMLSVRQLRGCDWMIDPRKSWFTRLSRMVSFKLIHSFTITAFSGIHDG